MTKFFPCSDLTEGSFFITLCNPDEIDLVAFQLALRNAKIRDVIAVHTGGGTKLVILARKRSPESWMDCVVRSGTSTLSIDKARVPIISHISRNYKRGKAPPTVCYTAEGDDVLYETHDLGKWPTNFIIDTFSADLLDAQSGDLQTYEWSDLDRSGASRYFKRLNSINNIMTYLKSLLVD